tara:strand:- start:969 stop:1613 length:645 start_codon:yes stop_codon:yes gene_type:complete
MNDILFGISAKDWAEIIRNYVIAASAIFTAWIAWHGLKNWKEQQVWKFNHDLAKELLTSSICVKTKALNLIMTSAIRSTSLETLHKGLRLTSESKDIELISISDDLFSQLQEVKKERLKFDAKGQEAIHVWGGDITQSFFDTNALLSELMYAANCRCYIARYPNSTSVKWNEMIKASQGRALQFNPSGDEFSTLLQHRFTEFNDHLKQYLEQRK